MQSEEVEELSGIYAGLLRAVVEEPRVWTFRDDDGSVERRGFALKAELFSQCWERTDLFQREQPALDEDRRALVDDLLSMQDALNEAKGAAERQGRGGLASPHQGRQPPPPSSTPISVVSPATRW